MIDAMSCGYGTVIAVGEDTDGTPLRVIIVDDEFPYPSEAEADRNRFEVWSEAYYAGDWHMEDGEAGFATMEDARKAARLWAGDTGCRPVPAP